jgi:hypothetical protein
MGGAVCRADGLAIGNKVVVIPYFRVRTREA